ncbi:Uncharacterised protein [Serratia marcescens]|nr:Uncharacterised protein [Serratia marcescens]
MLPTAWLLYLALKNHGRGGSMTKAKPYTAAVRTFLDELATFFVASEIERDVLKPFLEKEMGKPYNEIVTEGYLAQVLRDNPESDRAWKALQRVIIKRRKGMLAALERERNQHGR